MIKCLPRKNIDLTKWDQCVHSAPNGRLYAMSYYLDLVCNKGGWLGLVLGDYEAVMPLPLNNKAPLFTRIALPIFAQQLGVFTAKPIDEPLISSFIAAIPASYRSVYIQFNDANPMHDSTQVGIRHRSNFTLAIDRPYEEVYAGYSKNLKRNLKIAAKNELAICEIDNAAFSAFYLSLTEKEMVDKIQLDTFLDSLVAQIIVKEHGKIWGVKNEEGDILAACLLTQFNGRLTYLLSRSTPQGKDKRAMHFIIDEIIKANVGKASVLDFEGSEIPTVARFFQFFGAKDSPYPVLSYARFPFQKTEVPTQG